MANTFNIREKGPTAQSHIVKIRKELQTRLEGCFEPRCWLLKDPNDDGQLYLDKQINAGDSGRFVQIRRYLFLWAYDAVPDRRQILMRCGNNRCQNPAHARVKYWRFTPEDVAKMIELNWLTKKEAKEWFHWGE